MHVEAGTTLDTVPEELKRNKDNFLVGQVLIVLQGEPVGVLQHVRLPNHLLHPLNVLDGSCV